MSAQSYYNKTVPFCSNIEDLEAGIAFPTERFGGYSTIYILMW